MHHVEQYEVGTLSLAVDGSAVGTAMRGWVGRSPPGPLLAVPNVTSHPSTASIPITVLLCYNGPLHCGFNVPVKGLALLEYSPLCA